MQRSFLTPLVAIILPISFCRSEQFDIKGLLPPPSTGSPAIQSIREAFVSGNIDRALSLAQAVNHNEPSKWEGYFWRGFLELQRRNDYDAVRFLRKAESIDSNSSIHKALALGYYSLGQFRLFKLKMEQARAENQDDFAPYYYLGRFYASTDAADFPLAEKYLQSALERNPQHYAAKYYLGYCREAQGFLEEARKDYMGANELAEAAGSQFALPFEGLTRVDLIQNDLPNALSAARTAVALAPQAASGHALLAKVYAALHRWENAIPEWELASRLDPNDASAQFHLFQAYSRRGDNKRAKEALAAYQKISGAVH